MTITKVDTQHCWHEYRLFDYLSPQPYQFCGNLTLGLVQDVAQDMNWPELKGVLQDWETVGTRLDALKAIMQNMQVTIEIRGQQSGVVISTGGFHSVGAVLGGRTHAQFHERHPESPMADREEGLMKFFDVKLHVEDGEVKLDLNRQIGMDIDDLLDYGLTVDFVLDQLIGSIADE